MPRPEPASLAVAGAFLTRLPLRAGANAGGEDLARAAPLFPLVGGAIGALVGATAVGSAEILPPLIAGLLAVALELLLTGALHVDGLADSADGLGGHDRERSLAIMRDHALGSYGAAALVLDLTLKAASLAFLADADAFGAIVAALALSRLAPLPLARLLPYARPEGGSGRLLAGRVEAAAVLAGAGLALLIAVGLAGLAGLAMFAVAAATIALVGLASRHRLGGVTGDVMGAAVEISATATLLVAVAISAPQ